MHDKNRSFTRSNVAVEALIKFEGWGFVTDDISSISLNGMFLPCTNPPPAIGAQCQIVLCVGGRATGTRIKAVGAVARADERGVGIAFRQIMGTESLHHLRQLVLLNSPDPALTEHEFDFHVGLKRPPEPGDAEG